MFVSIDAQELTAKDVMSGSVICVLTTFFFLSGMRTRDRTVVTLGFLTFPLLLLLNVPHLVQTRLWQS